MSLKRYRFTNKERDDETGLYYFGVRYYAAWLGRWTSSDPGGFVDGLNLYVYVRNNPVKLVDAEGYEGELPTDESAPGPDHWVKKKSDTSGKSIIYWDDKAIDQASTKEGEEYLGEYHIHNDIDGSIYTFLPDGIRSHYRSEQALAGLENGDALLAREEAYLKSFAEGQARFMEEFNRRRSESGKIALDITITTLTFMTPLSSAGAFATGASNAGRGALYLGRGGLEAGKFTLRTGASYLGRGALAAKNSLKTQGFLYHGLKQGGLNVGTSFIANYTLSAINNRHFFSLGNLNEAISNTDIGDGVVGFIAGGVMGKSGLVGSMLNAFGIWNFNFTLDSGSFTPLDAIEGIGKKDGMMLNYPIDGLFNLGGYGTEYLAKTTKHPLAVALHIVGNAGMRETINVLIQDYVTGYMERQNRPPSKQGGYYYK